MRTIQSEAEALKFKRGTGRFQRLCERTGETIPGAKSKHDVSLLSSGQAWQVFAGR
jgi:hypothetical protein